VVTGLRKLHNEELNNVYTLSDSIRTMKSRSMRLVERVERIGNMRNAQKHWFDSLKERDQLEALRIGVRIVLKKNIREIYFCCVDWINLAQDRERWQTSLNTVKYLRIPQTAQNFFTSLATVSFLRMTVLPGIRRVNIVRIGQFVGYLTAMYQVVFAILMGRHEIAVCCQAVDWHLQVRITGNSAGIRIRYFRNKNRSC
jgi:hypothetical protein